MSKRGPAASEGWRKVVLRSMNPPMWLASDGEGDDIVISSRVRWARNLRGWRFPHHASASDLLAIRQQVADHLDGLGLEPQATPTEAERDYLVSCRLISAEFDVRAPGRMVALDAARALSLMVNEEDHLRFQSLTPGWSLREAYSSAAPILAALEQRLPCQKRDGIGYLTASPANVGPASRYSALTHLIGLAQTGRLTTVLKALGTWGMVTRGLFGESSRAVGAFFQVSAVHGRLDDFAGACEYLVREETEARAALPERAVEALPDALRAAVEAPRLALGDALRLVSWVRWAATHSEVQEQVGFNHRDIDRWTAEMEVHGTTDLSTADRHRAEFWRERLEPALQRVGPGSQ